MAAPPQDSARPARRASDRLIVALDLPTLGEAARLVDTLAPYVGWFKIGSELFTAAGPEAVAFVLARDRNVFLDLKFHDIPRTVAAAVGAAARLGVTMMNIHVAAGDEAMREAVHAAAAAFPRDDPHSSASNHSLTTSPTPQSPRARPRLLGITRLTSIAEEQDTFAQVVEAAARAKWIGLDGVIASPREAAAIKAACGTDFLVVTPGIRPAGSPDGDQRRTASPAEAVRAGADYVVVGRPVVHAENPISAVTRIIGEIDRALHQETRAPARNS
ncbi:MAG TPA: orotidine 5'-phosphate decarboxylase [bacterium]|nr:orotidine 5'-phosphate decarboxylase [bacterium]